MTNRKINIKRERNIVRKRNTVRIGISVPDGIFFFIIWPFTTTEISLNAKKIGQSAFRIEPNVK